MFKPIKDFITFIQNNTTNNGSEGEIDEEINVMDNTEPDEKNDSTQEKLVNSENRSKKTNLEITKNCLVTTNVVMASDFDEDDIELQIQSSIMLKNLPLKSSTPSPAPTTTSSVSSLTSSPYTSMTLSATCSKSYSADHNQNLQQKSHHFSPEDDDELADFKNEPLISTSYDDFHSINSETEELHINSADEAIDGLRTEDEDALEDTYPDEAVKREIIVVIENDLNSSIASSSADDPLAIDITTLPTSSDEAANPLDSSTNEENDEVSSIGGLNWFEGEDAPSKFNSTTTLPSVEIERISNTVATKQLQQSSGYLANKNGPINISGSEAPTEEEERYDNSDSGLGIETSSILLQSTLNNTISESSSYRECNQLASTSVIDGGLTAVSASSLTDILPDASPPLRSLRSNLKRRYCDEADVESNSLPESRNSKEQDIYPSKKPKRSINFDTVQVYYFPRQQGFGCVPSAGGCTLGMGTQHVDYKRLTLAEHAAELRRAHRLQLQEVNPRGSSSEDTDESEEDYLSEGSGSDLDADSNGFLQPVPPKQRRAILKAAGIRKIDTSEKVECRNIRNSREVCGCTCRDFCDPETCSCSRAGIKCQVDRAMFPCGCARDACGNTTGRVEFNPTRVRTHFIHTIMRLDMENRQQQQPMTLNGTLSSCYNSSVPSSSSSSVSISNHNGYYNMQTQSNYSSGYVSPAYTTEHNANYYQQQPLTYANTTDGETSAVTPYHSLDSVDGGAFTSNATNSVLPYGEIIPNYCPNNSTDTLQFNTTEYHPPLTYTPPYLSYQQNQQHDTNSSHLTTPQHSSSNNKNSIVDSVESSFNSCSVPSRQSYGVATTCNSSTIDITTNDSNLISLSTPIISSSRLTQINDLLQHNRNTPAALVAVSQQSGQSNPNTANSCSNNDSNLNSSIETSLNESHKGCLAFGSTIARAPVTTVLENPQQPSPQSKAPDKVIKAIAPIDIDSRVAVADYTI